MQVLNAYGKVYPTPPPSRRPIRVKQARLAAEKAAQEKQGSEEEERAQEAGVDGKGHTASGDAPDTHGRHKLGELSLLLTDRPPPLPTKNNIKKPLFWPRYSHTWYCMFFAWSWSSAN